MTATKELELVHSDKVYRLQIKRTSISTHDVTLDGRVVAVATRVRQNRWIATSKKTGQEHGGATMQTTICQLFYDEVERWDA